MALLNLFSSLAEAMPTPGGVWEWFLLKVFTFISNYGWRIIVFTILLKLALSPLDIYSRVMMRKNQKITERIKPEMEKLQAQYGHDRGTLSQKQMQLNKREGLSYMSTCLPMIVTMVVFIWMFSGVRNISEFMTMRQYLQIYDSYQVAYSEVCVENDFVWDEETNTFLVDSSGNYIVDREFATLDDKNKHINKTIEDAVAAGQQNAFDDYHSEYKITFLWIKNAWSADVPWKKPILDFSQFKSAINKYGKNHERVGVSDEMLKHLTTNETYDRVTKMLREDTATNSANGYLILPIFAVGMMFLSQFVTTRLQKKSGQMGMQGSNPQTMKMMMLIMPLMYGFFALSYTSIFTLYSIVNTTLSLLLTLSIGLVLRLLDKRSDTKINVAGRTLAGDEIVRYGRPDPNEKKHTKSEDTKKGYNKNPNYKKK